MVQGRVCVPEFRSLLVFFWSGNLGEPNKLAYQQIYERIKENRIACVTWILTFSNIIISLNTSWNINECILENKDFLEAEVPSAMRGSLILRSFFFATDQSRLNNILEYAEISQ